MGWCERERGAKDHCEVLYEQQKDRAAINQDRETKEEADLWEKIGSSAVYVLALRSLDLQMEEENGETCLETW